MKLYRIINVENKDTVCQKNDWPLKSISQQLSTFGAVGTLFSGVPVLLAGRVGGGAHAGAQLPHVLHRGQVLRLVILQPALRFAHKIVILKFFHI